MRFIASLMLMVLCCVGLSAAEFSKAQRMQIIQAAESLADGASGTIIMDLGSGPITVELRKGSDGSVALGGAQLPSEMRGSYLFSGAGGSYSFRANGGASYNPIIDLGLEPEAGDGDHPGLIVRVPRFIPGGGGGSSAGRSGVPDYVSRFIRDDTASRTRTINMGPYGTTF